MTKEIKQFFKDVYTVSPGLEERLQTTLANRSFKWLPITITGKTGDFENILLESIQKQCAIISKYDSHILKKKETYIDGGVPQWQNVISAERALRSV